MRSTNSTNHPRNQARIVAFLTFLSGPREPPKKPESQKRTQGFSGEIRSIQDRKPHPKSITYSQTHHHVTDPALTSQQPKKCIKFSVF